MELELETGPFKGWLLWNEAIQMGSNPIWQVSLWEEHIWIWGDDRMCRHVEKTCENTGGSHLYGKDRPQKKQSILTLPAFRKERGGTFLLFDLPGSGLCYGTPSWPRSWETRMERVWLCSLHWPNTVANNNLEFVIHMDPWLGAFNIQLVTITAILVNSDICAHLIQSVKIQKLKFPDI